MQGFSFFHVAIPHDKNGPVPNVTEVRKPALGNGYSLRSQTVYTLLEILRDECRLWLFFFFFWCSSVFSTSIVKGEWF